MINKIGIVGGGNIGGVLAAEIVSRRLARNVALVDVKGPDLAAGKCLDIAEATPVYGSDVNIVGAKTYDILGRKGYSNISYLDAEISCKGEACTIKE